MSLKDNLLATFPQLNSANETEVLKDLRKNAIKNFENIGFPTRKEEAWKFTSLNPVLKEDYKILFDESKIDEEKIKSYYVEGADTYKMVFVNGKTHEGLSTITETEEYAILPLSVAKQHTDYNALVNKHFGTIAEDSSMANLNTAMHTDGLFVYVKRSKVVSKPIELLYFAYADGEAAMLQPRNLIIVEDNAQVQIIERHQSLTENPVLTNVVSEIYNSKDALVDWYKIQADTEHASLVDGTYFYQEERTEPSVHTFSLGGRITRNNLEFYQHGERSNSILKGVTILEGREHVDHYTKVHHTQPDCESHQDYKGIYGGRSNGVFNGKIYVDKIAQRLDAYQQNNNIIVDDGATVNTKPQLEIFADDVRCSHGCTIGRMPEEAVFYLRSRGIPEKEANALLMYAFANTVLESVKIPALQLQVNNMIAAKLGVDLDVDFE